MTTALLDAVKREDNHTLTENCMATNKSSLDACVDFFFTAGAMRNENESRIRGKFWDAVKEDVHVALSILLWARDVRGGAGERRVFRTIVKSILEDAVPEALLTGLLNKSVELGRWDDILVAFETPNKVAQTMAVNLINSALNNGDGLCAKWMPRKGPIAAALRFHLGMTPKQYRKTLVGLTNVVENKMCSQKWTQINYEQVPSLASARYQKAFSRHDPAGYAEYRDKLQRGEAKINASAVYPYDVVKSVFNGNHKVANEQWKALPDYMEGSEDKIIVPVVDTSGSMRSSVGGNVSCMDVSVSLGLYLAEHNRGPFHNHFITFSRTPELQHIQGSNLKDKVYNLSRADWQMNTDIEAVFDLILRSAVKNKVSQEEMADYVLILSDMEFDRATRTDWIGGERTYNPTVMEIIDEKFEEAGYKRPAIIYWNIQSRHDNVPVTFDEAGTALVSGFSPAIMKSVLQVDLDNLTPKSIMLKTVDKERYRL